MPCKEWKNDWVAHLYEELEPEEERRLETHLGDCSECRETMDSLAASRRLLGRSAPFVPASPGVVVLRPRSSWRPAWAFAAGVACAAAVFAMGLYATPWIPGATFAANPTVDPESETPDPRDEAIQALWQDFRAFENRLTRVEQGTPQELVTQDRLDEELYLMERRLKQERARDYESVLEALTASEIRTGTWLGQTQDALDMLALRQDPRFRER